MTLQGIFDSELPICSPFVKWAGGKTQLLAKLDSFIPSQFSRYFEPFLGGGALFFHLTTERKNRPLIASCSSYYISDINPELMNTYLAVKENVQKLITLLTRHKTEYDKAPEEYYYKLRDSFNARSCSDNVERASQFITLNKTCFNGLYRVNERGLFNVPIGRDGKKRPRIYNIDSDNLGNVSIALNHLKAMIRVSNYKEVLLEEAKEGDFIYLDPPYNPESPKANFTGYTDTGFNDEDQKELATVFRKLDDRGCKVLLTNSDTQLIMDQYSDFAIVDVDTVRAINSNGSNRAGHKDLVVYNYSNIKS